jgi:phospho-N-acetylmuramoyl-pentapeptide-transferase
MGGVIIIIAILIPCILFGKLDNVYLILLMVTTVWLGAIGFWTIISRYSKKTKRVFMAALKLLVKLFGSNRRFDSLI